MKRSITIQFSLIFISILAGTIFMCLFANVFFLKDFYVASLKKQFLEAYYKIDVKENHIGAFNRSEYLYVEEITKQYNLSVMVFDSHFWNIFRSGFENEAMLRYYSDILPDETKKFIDLNTEYSYYFVQSSDYSTMNSYLMLFGVLKNGNYICLMAPLEDIENNVAIANRFLIQVSVFAISIGVILIVFMTRRVTTPIKQLANISNRMAHLDFTAHFQPRGNNEVDMLGKHINIMSDKLESTISELKTANNELRSDIELKSKNEEIRKEFIANISHELKTPISLIQGYAEGLKDGIHDDPESREFYCEVIIDEANRMSTMVKNLLALSELETGKFSQQITRFNLSELVQNILRSMEINFQQNRISLECEFEENVFVWADQSQVEDVFRNYITNAIRYIGGENRIKISFSPKDKYVRVTVFNTGQQIPEESIEHIWEKFYKVDKARTREFGGSGVGLSIVKAIMDSMNCDYGVQNEENGVSFYFELQTE